MKIPIKRERIYRALALEQHLTVSKISRKTGLAKSYVSKTIAELKVKGIIWGTEELQADQMKLLREWGGFKREIFGSIEPLALDVLFPDKIKEVLKDYVVSGPFAEMLVQGESPGRPIIIYVNEENYESIEKKLRSMGKTGRGIALVYAYDPDIFKGGVRIKGWSVASIPQVCADLVALGTYADLGINLYKGWIDAGRRI